MNLNADFTKRAVVHAATIDWKASPMPGVERRMLDSLVFRLTTNSYFTGACTGRSAGFSHLRMRST
jgi:hypothetical protein